MATAAVTPTMAAEVSVRTQRIRLGDDGIVRAELLPHIDVDRGDAVEAVEAIATIAGGRRRPVLVDIRRVRTMSREARMYFAGVETSHVESAAALLVASPLTRAIGNFFLGLNKPLFPTRLFTSEADAIAWLASFVVS
jgi:hypothetical protein